MTGTADPLTLRRQANPQTRPHLRSGVSEIGMLEAALEYASTGRPVVPAVPRGKRPEPVLAPHGVHSATTDPEEIRRLWRFRPEANVAIVTGAGSGLVVIDIDGEEGQRSLYMLCRRNGALGCPAWARTGSGGWHAYYRHPGTKVPNSTKTIAAGIDVRGDGGYVIAPPSVHPHGGTYTWHDRRSPGQLPPWLLALVTPSTRPVQRQLVPPLGGRRLDRWAASALRAEAQRVATAARGTRNDTLNRCAFRLGRLVGARLLAEGQAVAALMQAARCCGLEHREAAATIASGLRAGAANPVRTRR